MEWRRKCIVTIALSLSLLCPGCLGINPAIAGPVEVTEQAGQLRFNQIQYIGTHNSYHVAPWPELGRLAIERGYSQSEEWSASRLMYAVDFTHPRLTEQLDMGLRQFELDVHADPAGGKFENPGHLAVLRATSAGAFDDFDPDERLSVPGFKVFHGGLDMRSRCLLLQDCLQELKRWSDAHPRHFPIVIHIEAKDGADPSLDSSYTYPAEAAFGLPEWAALESEIVMVLGLNSIVAPAEVQGGAETLAEAIDRNGWPLLDQMAGRFVILLLNKREQTLSYLSVEQRLPHRIFFTSRTVGSDAAAWFRIPDPAYPELRRLIQQDRLVTVQADTHTEQARTNTLSRRDSAFASGAQFILTDFPVRDQRFTDYQVRFPNGGYVRCNPRTYRSPCPF